MRQLSEYAALRQSMIVEPWANKALGNLVIEYDASWKSKYVGADPALLCAIHYREASCNFDRQLLNGQKWSQVTTIVPKGFGPWVSFEAALASAITQHGIPTHDLTLDEGLQFLESWNGWGYLRRSKQSPYLWAGTQHDNTSGMYIADGRYSAVADTDAGDTYLGAGLIFLTLRGAYVPRMTVDVEFIKNIQLMLQQRNLYGGKIDGHFGPKTKAAFEIVTGVDL